MLSLLAINFFFGTVPYVEDVDRSHRIETVHIDFLSEDVRLNFLHCFAASLQIEFECLHDFVGDTSYCFAEDKEKSLKVDWKGTNALVQQGINTVAMIDVMTPHFAKIKWFPSDPSMSPTYDQCTLESQTIVVYRPTYH